MHSKSPLRKLDVSANRSAKKWSTKEFIGRSLWEAMRGPLFSWTPRPLWAWRSAVLRAFGAQIGRNVHICPSVRIAVPWNLQVEDNSAIGDCAIIYNLGKIFIGANTTISQNAHLCAGTHDFRRADMLLLKPPISIGEGVWICADAFIGPGVKIAPMAVIGARAVVVKDVTGASIVVGNPGRAVGSR